jgi:hypothetical protein
MEDPIDSTGFVTMIEKEVNHEIRIASITEGVASEVD